MKLLCAAMILALGITGAVCQKPEQYQNPIVRGMNPDPSVVRVGEDYYLATSSFDYFPSCPIYHSRDLVHWQRVSYAMSRPEQFKALHSDHPDTYATTLRYHKGTFYLITTDVHGGGNFFVTAKTAAGPWSDPIVVDHGMFDPSLFFDDDGKVYFTRRGPRDGENIVQAEIDTGTGKLLTPLRTISTGMVTNDSEGPHLYKIGGWYYLSQAEGGSRFLHMQVIGRSRSPWGPFESAPNNPWIAQHTDWNFALRTLGHCDIVDTPQGKWWTVCLGTRHQNYAHFSLGRETFLFPFEWNDGWPVVKQADMQWLTVDKPPLPARSWPAAPQHEDFRERNLSGDWNTFGPLGVGLYSLSERPGYLRLHGQSHGLSLVDTTAFVGRRQTEWRTESTTQLEFAPQDADASAGLTVFMSPTYHYDLMKTIRGGHASVVLEKHVGDITLRAAEESVADGPIRLRIESDAETYRFLYSAGGGSWKLLGTGLEKLIASEVANVWTGAYLGMFSACSSAPCKQPADFQWFDYKAAYEGRTK